MADAGRERRAWRIICSVSGAGGHRVARLIIRRLVRLGE